MDKAKLSRRQVLAGLAVTGSSGALVGSGTSALFSDTETFANNAIDASKNVVGVVDLNVTIESDDSGIVFKISLPEDDSKSDINNNPSHVWVRSDDCPNAGASDLGAKLTLTCNGSQALLSGEEPLGDIVSGLNEGILLSCDSSQSSSDPQDCLRPGETRKLELELTEDPSSRLSESTTFTLKFYGQQCRYNTGRDITNPFTETGPDSCSPPPTPGTDFCLFPCPVDPLTDLPVELEFDNSKLPPLFGDKGLSFIALCGDGLTNEDVTLNVTARNDDGEPTRVYWSVSNDKTVDQVAWKFGSANGNGSDGGTFKRVFPDGATEGSVFSNTDGGTQVSDGPPVECPDRADTKLKYEADNENDGLPKLDDKAGQDILPKIKQQLNEIDGITLTSDIINRNELTAIRSVRDQDSTGDIDLSREAIVGPTAGEDVIDVGGGNVTVSNYGAIIGTFTNTGGNDVVIKTNGAVAGDIGVEATDENGNLLKGTGNVKIKGGSTVVGDINTNTDGKNIKVKSGSQSDRSEVFGDAITSGGGSIIVKKYGRVSGSVETDEGGNVKVKNNSRIDGDAITSGGGNVTVGDNDPSVVGGVAKTTATGNGAGKVEVVGDPPNEDDTRTPENPAKVLSGVRAGGVAKIEDAEVKNGVEAGADCDIVNSDICGSVIADGNIDVYEYTVIQDGDIEAKGTDADVDAGETIAGIQNSFVGGDVIAKSGDIDFPSSVICGDIVAKNGAIDIYSEKTGPPLELDPNIPEDEQGGPRTQDRQRSLVGGIVRVEGEDCDIASATVFANGTTEPDKYDDDIAVLATKEADGGNDLTITDGPTGGSILKGDVVVNSDLNVDIDNGSRVEGSVKADAGTVSLSDVRVTGNVEIGTDGKVDQLDGDAVIEGDVILNGGTLQVDGPATIKGDLIVESGGSYTLNKVDVEGDVIEQ